MRATRTTKKKDGQTMLCPYFSEHYGGCLSTNMHGMSLTSVVDHCTAHYESCSVYQKFARAGQVTDYAEPCIGCVEHGHAWECKISADGTFVLVTQDRRRYS